MNKRPIRICGTEDQSLRYEARLPLQTGHSRSFRSASFLSVNGNAAFRAESVGFDLAADFLCSIVISVDLMAFQTRVVLRLVALPITLLVQTSIFLVPDISCNSLKSIMLGV